MVYYVVCHCTAYRMVVTSRVPHTQLLKDRPVALLTLGPERLREVALEVSSG